MDIIDEATSFAKKEYEKNDSNHQWSHIENVMKRALEIADRLDNVDYELLKLAAIFHDIDYNSEGNFKENYENHVDNGVKVAEKFLLDKKYPLDKIKKVKQIMLDHSTPHRKKFGESKTNEGKILYDADKSTTLDTLEKYNKYLPYLYFDISREMTKKPSK